MCVYVIYIYTHSPYLIHLSPSFNSFNRPETLDDPRSVHRRHRPDLGDRGHLGPSGARAPSGSQGELPRNCKGVRDQQLIQWAN